MSAAERVYFHEVAPRDGLQNEARILPLAAKLRLVELLAAARPDSIEIGSFVRPDRIPQLADTAELAAALGAARWPRPPALVGLAPNLRGYQRLRAAGLDGVSVLVSATESHNRANLNRSIAASLEELQPVLRAARADGLTVRAYVSMAFGCPYEGQVELARVLDLVAAFAGMDADLVLLADTLGVAEPREVGIACERALELLPRRRLGLHLHDTFHRAIDNARAGYQAGARWFDGAVAGCGGCPYAPGAAGNADSEALLAMFEGLGVAHGVERAALHQAADFLRAALGRTIAADDGSSAGPV